MVIEKSQSKIEKFIRSSSFDGTPPSFLSVDYENQLDNVAKIKIFFGALNPVLQVAQNHRESKKHFLEYVCV